MGRATLITTAGLPTGSSAPVSGGSPSPVVITSAAAIDTSPDASGNPRKQVTVTFTPPSPLGGFAGCWVYLNAPDSSGGGSVADGTVAADGTNAASGVFNPSPEGFFAFLIAAATISGSFTGNPTNGQSVTIAGKTYTFQSSLTNVDGNVAIGFTSGATSRNLIAAINLAAGAGTVYAAATTANANASATITSLTTGAFSCTALVAGTSGNSLTCSATAPITFVNGGTFSGGISPNFQITFVCPAPTTPQYWRVYLCSGSKTAQVPPVENGQLGASPSFQFFVGMAAGGSTGREYAPNVLNPELAPTPAGWAGNPDTEVAASGDQYLQYAATWNWPSSDQNYAKLGGVNLILENDTTGIQTYIGNVPVTNGSPTYISPHLPVLPGTNNYTLYLIAYDVNGNNNSLQPGITPQITFSITRSLGPAGAEYCGLVTTDGTNPLITVIPQINSADGTALLQVTGYFTRPSDPQWGGAEIFALKPDGTYYSIAKGTVEPIANDVSQPSTVQEWAFYIRSIDINGNPDSIGPKIKFTGGGGTGAVWAPVISGGAFIGAVEINEGTGYSTAPTATLVDGAGNPIPGVTLTATVSGGGVATCTGSGGSGIVAMLMLNLAVGSATGALNLAQAAPSSFSTQFAISGNKLVITTLDASVIDTGVLEVGFAGTGIPIEVQIFDHLGGLIGWIGDDTVPIVGYPGSGSGFVGAWFKQLRVGGASPASAPLVADSSGNIAIIGNNVSISITSTAVGSPVVSLGGSISGLEVSAGTAQSVYSFGSADLTGSSGSVSIQLNALNPAPVITLSDGVHSSALTNVSLAIQGLPSSSPGSGTKQFWYDPADSNRVKFAP